ncbi:MAG: crossover junction endodeoxyribonuclease RuvC, partial [Anaerolineales bacterium]|nr:crossover junction endodeoxyribonuclease RuvC [Anaerolineales bacterium]
MRVIGIDPGIAITGYGVVDELADGSIEVVDYGAVLTSSKTPSPERLSQIFHSLNDLLDEHRPASGAVEKLFFQKNVRTAMTVGQARGVALLALAENKVSIAEYTPLEIKQAVTGYGS